MADWLVAGWLAGGAPAWWLGRGWWLGGGGGRLRMVDGWWAAWVPRIEREDVPAGWLAGGRAGGRTVYILATSSPLGFGSWLSTCSTKPVNGTNCHLGKEYPWESWRARG